LHQETLYGYAVERVHDHYFADLRPVAHETAIMMYLERVQELNSTYMPIVLTVARTLAADRAAVAPFCRFATFCSCCIHCAVYRWYMSHSCTKNAAAVMTTYPRTDRLHPLICVTHSTELWMNHGCLMAVDAFHEK
jgi:hypothetical protein